jgi:hypothetical protein
MIKLSGFRSPQGEAEYRAAYDAVLQGWPFMPSPPGVLRYFFGNFAVDTKFATLFSLGVMQFRYADPRRSVFPVSYTDDELRRITTPALLLIGDNELPTMGPRL